MRVIIDMKYIHNDTVEVKFFIFLIYNRGSLNKFPDFFRMGTFIDSTHMKLESTSK